MLSQPSPTPPPFKPGCESPAHMNKGAGIVKRRSRAESKPVMIGSSATYARYVIGDHQMPESFAKLLLGTLDMNFEVSAHFVQESHAASCILVEALDKERTSLEEKRAHFKKMTDLMTRRITDLDEARSKAREAVEVTLSLVKEVAASLESNNGVGKSLIVIE
ncbi:hypothetical protein BV22DRAFT_1129856 [Leucogyrophana mollusca]|uniref:Uncharacterized protein n=1 Tax=Leucogyrophana mollusca TaxID=85980 RepID=A0ACB8BGJ6_9AGAM|nr:hypothetical protein BV22DRAFT_1129856 [Leucogyrophana mollusca]